ncbi:hypothetical protein [Nitratireductor sp.]|uniref:hypothetical protein n=1 Tax=Nitratireductor sp. TaxID=1872084 RepID=UPI0026233B1A|nr:hypothetical protein [Nitratireductor sp.]
MDVTIAVLWNWNHNGMPQALGISSSMKIETLVVCNGKHAMGVEWSKGILFLREAAARMRFRRENTAINTVGVMCDFVCTRSSFVAQKKLYGYLKARMGTRYPSMFEDDVFVESINIAKLHVFAACLSDLTVHAVARVASGGALEGEEARTLALHCHEAGLADNGDVLPDAGTVEAWRSAFVKRIADVHWQNAALAADCFTESPKALFKWAPIADELKRYDREIVENSIRFAFGEVTRSFRERAELPELAQDWRAQSVT